MLRKSCYVLLLLVAVFAGPAFASAKLCSLNPFIVARSHHEVPNHLYSEALEILGERYGTQTEQLISEISAQIDADRFELEVAVSSFQADLVGSDGDTLKQDAVFLSKSTDTVGGNGLVLEFIKGHGEMRQAYLIRWAEAVETGSRSVSDLEADVFFGLDLEPDPEKKEDGSEFFYSRVDAKDGAGLHDENSALEQFDIARSYAQLNRILASDCNDGGVVAPFVIYLDQVLVGKGGGNGSKGNELEARLCSRMAEALEDLNQQVKLRCKEKERDK